MPRREFIGGFELLVLLALVRLGEEAYGVTIGRAIGESSGREVAIGSVYITLERLERKGLVSSRLGEPTAERAARVSVDAVDRLARAAAIRFVVPGDEEWPDGLNDLRHAETVQRRGGEPTSAR